MEKISIIMPVYNAEKFLNQSIESVLNQTYKKFELIIVDDGSKDSSGSICDEYAKKDQRIKVIHKRNGGSSTARNKALDIADGKYIMFIDADDFFEPNSCKVLYNEIEKRKADYVIGNYIHTNYEGEKWENPLFNPEIYDNFKLSITDYKKSFFVMNSVIWNKIIRRDFIEKNHLRFIKSDIAEDAVFSIYCYTHSDNGYFINDVIYNYRQNKKNNSVSTSCTKQYFEKINYSYKLIFQSFKETDNIGFYRFFYARIMPYLLCKIIDSNFLDKESTKEVIEMLAWFFEHKELYKVAVLNRRLNKIVKNINEKKYEEALENIAETKIYRENASEFTKEKMYAPSEELYKIMTE